MVASAEEIASFASEEVLGTLAERYEAGVFSRTLWKRMGEIGLLGLTVPEEYGGSGGTPLELAVSLREFARAGCDLGLTLSWITHLALCEKSIEDFGTHGQKLEYLPRLSAGELVGAAAVSEPRTGAHPGGIGTVARETSSGFTLEGEKIYITDGPVADVLVVMAATGEEGGRKELSTFLVESKAEGFSAKQLELNFLKTSPHGRMLFDGVVVRKEAMLGARGEAHSKFSRAAFSRERSLVIAAMPGHFESAARVVARGITARLEGFDLEGTPLYSWIHHMAALEGYRRLSSSVVEDAFRDPVGLHSTGSMDVLVYLGVSYAKWAGWIQEVASSHGVGSGFPLELMLNDMRLVMVGEKLLVKEGRKRFVP
ncbi:MAG TPA: acyl-CoA dehydrogenase family protein [Candidatus Anoxymicrobiaceae bacterium]